MLATGITCFFLGIGATLAVQGFAAWVQARGLRLSTLRWVACAAWAALLLLAVFFPAVSVGEGEPRAALYGLVAGLGLLVPATWALLRYVLRSPRGA